MAEDPEKRFHTIMEKLFHAPPPKPISTPSSSSLKGRKRGNLECGLALVEPGPRGEASDPASPPLCRPWDRGDLMRRLATFKSMSWFAKPKVVGAVNCARRGWINVDMDIIACEACGARLLFATPASWTQQQVEKAALVFSLKLDSGHKLHCPWIDNACDERLTEFPPTPPPVLVDKFRERSAALLQLLALPVISSSAIGHMRNPQLEAFLKDSPMGGSEESSPSLLYHQAQKLISLCGWEPRSLPYAVESKDRGKQLVKVLDILNLSRDDAQDSSVNVHDPNSVALDCRLCGASVGLWTFSLVQRPLELFRLVGYTELNNKRHCTSADRPSNINLTIAGGPSPTQQNFKAIISIPMIGQNLRAKLSRDSDFRDRKFSMQQDAQSDLGAVSLFAEERDYREQSIGEEGYHPDGLSIVRIQPHNHDYNDHEKIIDPSSCLDSQYGKNDDIEMMISEMLSAGPDVTMPELAEISVHDGSVMDHLVQTETNTLQGLGKSDALPGDAQDGTSSDSALADPRLISTHDHSDQQQIPREDTFCSKDYAKLHLKEGEVLKRLSTDKAMEFDPIRQHRYFCPWIASTTSALAGWQQTLNALHRNKEHSNPSFLESPPSASIIRVDNPIASVRRLFKSPSAKKMKSAHGSS